MVSGVPQLSGIVIVCLKSVFLLFNVILTRVFTLHANEQSQILSDAAIARFADFGLAFVFSLRRFGVSGGVGWKSSPHCRVRPGARCPAHSRDWVRGQQFL